LHRLLSQIEYKVKFKGLCTKTVKNGFELYQKQNLRLFLLNFTKKILIFYVKKLKIDPIPGATYNDLIMVIIFFKIHMEKKGRL